MAFPLVAAGAAALIGGGLWAGKEFGEEAGKKAGTVVIILVAGALIYLMLRKTGKV